MAPFDRQRIFVRLSRPPAAARPGLWLDLGAHEVTALHQFIEPRAAEPRRSSAEHALEAGQVHLPERAPWLADLQAELFSFPASRYDDQVDCISQALNYDHALSL